MDIFGGERFEQAAECEVGHRETGRIAGHEQARNVIIAEPHRDRETGRTARQLEIDQSEIGVKFLRRRDRAVEIVGPGDHAVARIVLDQIFERRRQLRIVFDNQDLQHLVASPAVRKIQS